MKVFGPFIMPDEHAAVIGRIAEGWAQLEFQIDRGIWTLLRTEHQFAACVTAQLSSVHFRMKAFIALVELHGGSEATLVCLRRFSGNVLSSLQERRNRAVHDPRARDKGSALVHRLELTAKPKIKFGFEPEPLDDLSDLHKEIYTAVSDFSTLRDAAIAEIEALPAESRPKLLSIIEMREAPANPPGESPTPPSRS